MAYALITGASRGIGAATALVLAEKGLDVVIGCRSHVDSAKRVAQKVEELGQKAAVACFDVSDAQQTATAIEGLLEEHGAPRVLVNNAGVTRDGMFAMMGEDSWSLPLRTHLDGFYYVTRPVVRAMLKAREGRIVNVASVAGIRGSAGQVNYSASKAGLIGATKALALELAGRSITVNAVAPGLIETEMTEDVDRDKAKAAIALGRFGKPEEVAKVIAFLVSDAASYITGEVIHVNGGLYT